MPICEKVIQTIDEVWEETVESFVKKVEKFCKSLPWPLNWVCKVVETVIKVVTVIVHHVIKTIVSIICYPLAGLLVVLGVLVQFISIIPFIGPWIKALINGITWVWSQFVGLVDAGLGFFGLRPIKHLRLHVIVLLRQDGSYTAPPSQIQLAIDRSADILRRRAHIKLHTEVHPMRTPAEPNALHIDTGFGLIFEDSGPAGRYFKEAILLTLGDDAMRLLTLSVGAPLVLFVVDGVGDSAIGCSAGPFADYVVVEGGQMVTLPMTGPVPANFVQSLGVTFNNASSTAAHEICHALGLLHEGIGGLDPSDATNLMYPYQTGPTGFARGDNLSPFQRAIIRASPRVTYV
jgi:hypothetical protein